VPINNQCPECAVNHVDLSEPAFLYLEPQGGTVGIAKGENFFNICDIALQNYIFLNQMRLSLTFLADCLQG
jgi:hypothetical protein